VPVAHAEPGQGRLSLGQAALRVGDEGDALKVGGIMVSYSPSINQSRQLAEVLDDYMHQTFEAILRNWKAPKMSPDTRMLGHTGFLTVARRLK